MKTRVTISVLTLLFLLVAAVMVMAGDAKKEAADSSAAATGVTKQDSTLTDKPEAPAAEPKLIAYYFHGTRRCVTCKKLESYTQEAIEAGFAEQLKSGVLAWRPVNTDESDNEHFRKDYALYTKSVVLSERKEGKEVKWKNLDKIWELVRGDKEAYVKYIQDEVTAFLGES